MRRLEKVILKNVINNVTNNVTHVGIATQELDPSRTLISKSRVTIFTRSRVAKKAARASSLDPWPAIRSRLARRPRPRHRRRASSVALIQPSEKAAGERPAATLLSASLRPVPPLWLHPNSGAARIVAYRAAPSVDAPPASRPFALATLRRSIRPSICIPSNGSASISSAVLASCGLQCRSC